MSLHPDILDTMLARGATAEMIVAAYRTAYELENKEKAERRAGAAARKRAQRRRDGTANLVDEMVEPRGEQTFIDAAIENEVVITSGHTTSRDVTDVTRDKRNPHKENTSSLRSSEVKNYATTPARELEPLVSAEAHEMAEAIGREAGFEPKDTPPGWCGAANMIQAFMTQGISAQHLRTAATTVLRRRTVSGRGPPENFAYFRKPLAEICGDLRTPVPKVAERNLEVIHGGKDAGARAWRNDGHSRNYGSATDAASDLRRYFARCAEEEERAAAGMDCLPSGVIDGVVSS